MLDAGKSKPLTLTNCQNKGGPATWQATVPDKVKAKRKMAAKGRKAGHGTGSQASPARATADRKTLEQVHRVPLIPGPNFRAPGSACQGPWNL